MVDKVIPYLPMDPASIVLVIELKMQRLAETLPGGLYTTRGGCLEWFLTEAREGGRGCFFNTWASM